LVPLVKVLKLIEELNAAIGKLKRMVGRLERLSGISETTTPSRQGRKSMGAEERLEVSKRMKKYWAARRRQQGLRRP
jgi:hypothetical protein